LLIALSAIYGYFILWSLIGLPVTLSSVDYLNGGTLQTIQYNDLFTNAIEVGQWFLAAISFAFATKRL
jgi:hypothetical protein